jgi:FKBP-type peptidyl-prolyl cis-trans isomerase FklB
MKKFAVAVVVLGVIGCQSPGQKSVKLASKQDSVSYSIGMNVGNSLKRDSIVISPEAFLRGVTDASADSAVRMLTETAVQEVLQKFQMEMREKQMTNAKAAGEKQKAEGDKFLAENAKKPGVVTLPSGLQYRVLTEGKGKKPTEKSTVVTHYSGKLLDGTEFDSSYKRGEPATFPLSGGGLIRGWTEGLQLMREGSKYEFYIPPQLAYGEAGAGSVIPPNATLIFQVELVAVK